MFTVTVVDWGLGWQKLGLSLDLLHSILTNPTIPTPWLCSKLKPTVPPVVSPVHNTAATQLL